MISVLNDKNEPEKIAEYISLLIQSPALKESAHLCDREILDAILCRYQTRCRERVSPSIRISEAERPNLSQTRT